MSNWQRYQKYLVRYEDSGLSLDISLMGFDDAFIGRMSPLCERAFADMKSLEAGEIANPNEERMVGHYWLRNSALAPNDELRAEIERDLVDVKAFASAVHAGEVSAANGGKFTDLLLIGIGGSALGPQLVADALAATGAKMRIHFFDNTDPDGMDRTLAGIADLATTMVLVISKSGGTKETRNGMLEAEHAFKIAGLEFPRHAVAITGPASKLDQIAESRGWIKRFPMSDWVGGRTSVMSVVGLVPAALQGVDIDAFLAGAAAIDEKTRSLPTLQNASMLLALMWHYAGRGKGEKDMVVLPYKDRLLLLSKYLQQLVMESLGKELDLDGNVVNQGIAVYGNKGSTDQHAYVQQLRDGVHNFFVTFIEILEGREGESLEVEPATTSADFLQGFLRGTRKALFEGERESVTITVPELDARSLGSLIALFERAVSFYASLVNINAYHQPGVESGKKAATSFVDLLGEVRNYVLAHGTGNGLTADDIGEALEADPESVFHCLQHLAANNRKISRTPGATPAEDSFIMA